jgi:hypothetical protein
VLKLFFIIVVLLSLVLTACTSARVALSATTTSSTGDTVATTTPEITDYSKLGLTDEEIDLWENRGIANVDSPEVASALAGFPVSVPGYIPDEYSGGKYSVTRSGAGLPEEMRPKFNNTTVQRIFTVPDNRDLWILLIQARSESTITGSHSVDICSHPAQKALTAAEPENGQPYDKLTLLWVNESVYFTLTVTLAADVDEAALLKIACSVFND